ncbi:MAG: polysaccharide biosynthesis tyrosine autokinase [Chthoniobacteraceae bacterium]
MIGFHNQSSFTPRQDSNAARPIPDTPRFSGGAGNEPGGQHAPGRDDAAFAAFDVRALASVLRHRAWWIAGFMVAGLLLGIALAAMRPGVFEAGATVQVVEESPRVTALQETSADDLRQPETIKTIEQQLGTRNLMWRVIQANGLDTKPGAFRPGWIQRLQGRTVSRSDMIDALSAGLTVKLRRGTRLIDIAARHADPAMAQTLVRSLIEEYSAQDAERQAKGFEQANRFLIDESERLKRKLESSERALQEYREKNQAVSLDEKQNIIVERLKELNLRAAKAQTERVALESDLAQIDAIGREPDRLLGIGTIANAPSVLDARRFANEKEAAFALLRQRYGPENPAHAQAAREFKQVKATLDATVLNAADALRATCEAARVRHEAAERTLREQEQVALDLNRKAVEYNTLSREVESDRALFEPVLKRLKENGVVQGMNAIRLHVVEPPTLPESPAGRNGLLLVALGLFGGTALGLGGVVGRYLLNPTLQTVDDAGRVLGVQAIGTIPCVRGLKLKAERLPGVQAPRSVAAEAFRFAAAMAAGGGNRAAVLFCSPAPGQGNTFCAASYALALAQSGARTLLIDANLRTPAVGRIFSVPPQTIGLAECLAGSAGLEAAVLPSGLQNLSVLAAGIAPRELTGVFSGATLGSLLAEAAGKFDRVVIDSAPVNIASETLLLAKQAGAIFLIVGTGRTPVAAASRASQLIEAAGRPASGFLLNRVPPRAIV